MDDTQILKQQIESAPEEIRTFLVQKKWTTPVNEISNKYGFLPEQKTALENEVIFVLLGLDTSSNFQRNFQTEAGVSELVSRIINTEIQNRIFKQFSQYLPTEEDDSTDTADSISVPEQVTEIEIAPNILPMVEPGEVAHDTTPEEKAFMNTPTVQASVPETKNEERLETPRPNIVGVPQYTGEDPYREAAN